MGAPYNVILMYIKVAELQKACFMAKEHFKFIEWVSTKFENKTFHYKNELACMENVLKQFSNLIVHTDATIECI